MRYFVLSALMLLVSACNLQTDALPTADDSGNIYITATPILPTPNTDGVIVITATPNPDVVQPVTNIVQATSELPATAILPPTATMTTMPLLNPQEELDRAEVLLLNGYREDAVRTYQALLNQTGLSPEIRGEAGFKLGQTAVREGLFNDALQALTVLITELPNDAHIAQAYFLRGDAYLGLGMWSEAIADFQQYLALRPGLIDSYTYERIADAQFALGQVDSALTSYNQALAANRSLVPMLILREKLAAILVNLGRVDEAVAQYDAILDVARNAPYRASIDMYAAQAYMNAGRTDAGAARAQRVFDNYTETNSAYSALQILIDNGADIDGYRQGLVYYNYGDYQAAINAFNDYTSSFQLAAIPANLYLLLGRAYRQIGNSQAALVAFQTLIDNYPSDALFGEALLERGRTHFLASDIPTAIETYTAIGDNYGHLATIAPEALWRAGYLYAVHQSDFVAARDLFIRIANDYPGSEWAVNGLQIAASNAVSQNELALAENLYGRIAALATGEERAAALYWVGRLAQMNGNISTAQQAFAEASAAAPGSFYSERANDIAQGREAFSPPPTLSFNFDEITERQQAEAWLRTTFGITQAGDLYTPSAELMTDPRMIRGQELWNLADVGDARNEFELLLDESRETGNVLRSYQLAHYFESIGNYYDTIVAAADVINASGQATLAVPPYIARMRYPAYYNDLVVPEANKYGFDPLLLFSLIRQESLYNAQAVSIASAKGLTQVIPSTAQYIATELNWASFQDTDLYRPYVSIAFGAYYLDEQLRIFDGNRAAALAAYNAGPGYTLDWVALAGDDVDALVATIQFDETRRYVQRIYSHYTIYRQLYGG